MIRFQTHPVFCGLALMAVAAIAAEGWLLVAQRAAAVKTAAQFHRLEQERRTLAGASPFPSAANAAKIAAELARHERELAARRSEWLGKTRGPEFRETAPASSTDAYFDLAAFIEETREKARAAGVGLAPDERFGFSAYAHQGPPAGLIAAVFGERQLIQGLVSALIEARPKRLLAVQREPAGNAGAGKNGGAETGVPDPDLFGMDSRLTAREPGRVATTAFRVSFTGQTAVLRAFLHALADLDRPLMVRGIEVGPMEEGAGEIPALAPAAGGPAPIVAQNLSRFTVTVECSELAEASAPAS